MQSNGCAQIDIKLESNTDFEHCHPTAVDCALLLIVITVPNCYSHHVRNRISEEFITVITNRQEESISEFISRICEAKLQPKKHWMFLFRQSKRHLCMDVDFFSVYSQFKFPWETVTNENEQNQARTNRAKFCFPIIGHPECNQMNLPMPGNRNICSCWLFRRDNHVS